MHTADLTPWQHTHQFHSTNRLGERNTRRVVALTAVMMVVEIIAGWMFNSMALLADGWHMSSHVLALGLTAGAYVLSRRFANDPRFAFGTWKIEVLGGFTSAILLVGVAIFMAMESVGRLFQPVPILFDQAIIVAVVALVGGRFFHWNWLDATMGIVGVVVVGVWAWGLLRDTSRVLLDREMDSGVVAEIREVLGYTSVLSIKGGLGACPLPTPELP